jgi:hypothetical protein
MENEVGQEETGDSGFFLMGGEIVRCEEFTFKDSDEVDLDLLRSGGDKV